MYERTPRTTLGLALQAVAVKISEGVVAFWDHSQRQTKECM